VIPAVAQGVLCREDPWQSQIILEHLMLDAVCFKEEKILPK
jgi:hypothetical protein